MIFTLIPRFDPAHPRSAVENMKLLADAAPRFGSLEQYLAFIHDDVEIDDPETSQPIIMGRIQEFFEAHPRCGMAGFGGATGLGTDDLYKHPYDLRQLARVDFISNMREAEAHGRRVTTPTRVAVLDGFSQIIRRMAYDEVGGWSTVLKLGITFHMYDFAMACLLAEKGWEVWMLPIPCHHRGGQTSCSPEYDRWLRSQGIAGDSEVHRAAHRICYERFRDILPLRV